jgi:hypothetical protein
MCGGLLRIPKNICGTILEPRTIAANNSAADRSAATGCSGAVNILEIWYPVM